MSVQYKTLLQKYCLVSEKVGGENGRLHYELGWVGLGAKIKILSTSLSIAAKEGVQGGAAEVHNFFFVQNCS